MHFKNRLKSVELAGLALQIALIIIISGDVAISGRCPSAEVVSPCECDPTADYITCIKFNQNDFNASYTLPQIFEAISAGLSDGEKNFTKLLVAYTHILVIEENTFSDITFESIEIYENNLTRVHSKAFDRNQHTLKNVSITGLRLSYNQLNYSLFDALSSVISLESVTLNLGLSSFTQIPSNAFRNINGVQTNLREINLLGMVSGIGDNAFNALPNLRSLKILDQLSSITEHAFDFSDASTEPLRLNLAYNRLVSSSFAPNIINANRAVQLNLAGNRISYLDENIFGTIIAANSGNTINVFANPLNCTDCRNYWIVEKQLYRDRIEEAICNYGIPVQNHNWICDESTTEPSTSSPTTSTPTTISTTTCDPLTCGSSSRFLSFYVFLFVISLKIYFIAD